MSNPVSNRRIVLGVTGSIAAYKAGEIASRLTQWGAQVDVILTSGALHFITPLTFQSLTSRKAYTDDDLWGGEGHVTHVGLGRGAELIVIAPATANTLSKLAYGIADNLLVLTVLASQCPLLVAPAMDAGMFQHPATQEAVRILEQRGVMFIGPAEGRLASGLVGRGRMVEPAEVLAAIRWRLGRSGPLAGRKVVVTAGGTQEPIDAVRVITNRSSGKQGYALAQAALDVGAEVVLITTSTALTPPYGARVIMVRTAADMLEAVLREIQDAEALLMAAAVADFRPRVVHGQKIKKEDGIPALELEATPDILMAVAEQRAQLGYPRRVIGFAAESDDLLIHAQEKLQRKRLDMIVANDISATDAGFEVDTNRVTLLFADGRIQALPLMSKEAVAEAIIQQLVAMLT
ncbi:bifunctional phosphopantothenoylcysteine decarboxylase/phosphopantothenate--cysteine ligase CoaBC [Thermanaerothrix sp. 4228-RoL]|uniref:Coenzyme A biosynthesis bifunctional protein CoaBC n=1 Tax=Thermanaerothrix solaris TaxID=3058434 RepID=A0ABU3NIN1_9CHLR|nr:bifunctional phosphopantothenoylcysteine decarboxylase/phosphopantothenate--cysteine ligase CoaBC [Thermanaerothrix sp. 4228-RoL]MDT8896707.1 bifunctional phosphopantothenoylcysteine decarboxylase/phosphopantothenate--cysteine ligase CoaBC [Thermanaerothrix sp. 4228-RoL]